MNPKQINHWVKEYGLSRSQIRVLVELFQVGLPNQKVGWVSEVPIEKVRRFSREQFPRRVVTRWSYQDSVRFAFSAPVSPLKERMQRLVFPGCRAYLEALVAASKSMVTFSVQKLGVYAELFQSAALVSSMTPANYVLIVDDFISYLASCSEVAIQSYDDFVRVADGWFALNQYRGGVLYAPRAEIIIGAIESALSLVGEKDAAVVRYRFLEKHTVADTASHCSVTSTGVFHAARRVCEAVRVQFSQLPSVDAKPRPVVEVAVRSRLRSGRLLFATQQLDVLKNGGAIHSAHVFSEYWFEPVARLDVLPVVLGHFQKEEITCLFELCQYTRADLKTRRGFGDSYADSIESELAKLGLGLGIRSVPFGSDLQTFLRAQGFVLKSHGRWKRK